MFCHTVVLTEVAKDSVKAQRSSWQRTTFKHLLVLAGSGANDSNKSSTVIETGHIEKA